MDSSLCNSTLTTDVSMYLSPLLISVCYCVYLFVMIQTVLAFHIFHLCEISVQGDSFTSAIMVCLTCLLPFIFLYMSMRFI